MSAREARAPLLSREQSRLVDQTLAAAGVPGIVLMENAGSGAAQHVLAWGRAREITRATIAVGPGNNGGDGLVVARHLALAGWSVRVIALGDAGAMKGDAAVMRDAWVGVGGGIERAGASVGTRFDDAVVIDALFGTGLTRPLEGTAAAFAAAMNARATRTLTVSLDVPSGLDADTGAPLGSDEFVVRASHTITFGTAKPGLVTGFGRKVVGELHVVPIGATLPAEVFPAIATLVRSAPLAPRDGSAHKGDNGRVLVVGGSPGTVGAAVLSARGAHRAGGGLITIASRAAASLDGRVVETMTRALPDDPGEAAAMLVPLVEKTDAVVVGPGLGKDDWARAIVQTVLQGPKPTVIDGDALTLLGERGGLEGVATRVLTPHPLEMARLLGLDGAAAVNQDRYGAARTCATRYRAVVVLKGAGTVIATPDGGVWVIDCAEAALGVPGSGDVLSGVIAARLAERGGDDAAVERAIEAAVAHGRAGERVHSRQGGSRGALASEIADAVAAVLEDGTRG